MPHSWANLVPDYNDFAFRPLHSFCYYTLWQHVPANTPFGSPNIMELLPPVILGHTKDAPPFEIDPPGYRRFFEVALPISLRIRPGCRAGLNATLRAAAGVKQWTDPKGPVPEAQQLTATGYSGCPNGLGREGHAAWNKGS